jgi:translation elongation factor EF-G
MAPRSTSNNGTSGQAFHKRLNDVIVAVEVLQRESVQRNTQIGVMVEKMDKTIEKFQDLSIKITEMLTRHDSSIGSLSDTMSKHVVDTEKNFEELKSEHKSLDQRVGKLEQWKWMIMGGAAVIGALFSQIDRFFDAMK